MLLTIHHPPPLSIFFFVQIEHELVTDTAARLCFQTYLNLARLPFTNKVAVNVHSMSPDGTTPFIVLQLSNRPFIICNFQRFLDFLNSQVSLTYSMVSPSWVQGQNGEIPSKMSPSPFAKKNKPCQICK